MKQEGELTYSEAIGKVMIHNGYFAPLKLIYQNIWRYKDFSKIKGKTPEYTIQAIVQRDSRFTRIGLGVYALTQYLDRLPKVEITAKTAKEKAENMHTNMQGMILEIGNAKSEVKSTFTNDKARVFQNKPLGNLATLKRIPQFTYKNIIEKSARFADVIWFNQRGFPLKIFEVEHSTDFRDAFIKFIELQDFQTIFCCVSPSERQAKFERELNKTAFEPIRKRCIFVSYAQVQNDYEIALKKTYL